ncbi:paraquat-inducible membrane protein A, partial [Vibrio vulnificus]
MTSPTTHQHQTEIEKVRLCQGCELPVDVLHVAKGRSAYCPRCGTQLYRGGNPSLSG